jgi:DNA-binding transcriptional MerR regulator
MTPKPQVFTPKQAADQVGCSPDTIRRYAKEFSRHLSEGATPSTGQPRLLTAVDVYLLQLVKQEVDRKTSPAAIHSLLESVALPEALVVEEEGRAAGDILTLPSGPTLVVDAALDGSDAGALVRRVTSTLATLEATALSLEDRDRRIAQAEAQIEELRSEVVDLRKTGQESRLPIVAVALAVAVVALVALVAFLVLQAL